MRVLSRDERKKIIRLLVEGVSLRSISRATDHKVGTCLKLLADAGEACILYHDRAVRGVNAKRIESDELWDFVYAKSGTLASGRVKNPPPGAGSVWIWTALDPDSKLLVSWRVGDLDHRTARGFLEDLKSRLAGRVQLTTDGRILYPGLVRQVFGDDIDYAQIVKKFGSGTDEDEERRYSPSRVVSAEPTPIVGDPDPDFITTSHVERMNGTLRESVRRITRLTHGFSKRLPNLVYHLALYVVYYNFCWEHSTLKGVSPAVEAGLASEIKDINWIVQLIEENTPAPGPRGPYRPRRPRPLVARERSPRFGGAPATYPG